MMCHDYLCFTTCLIMPFSKTWLRWKSVHSAAASSQAENESKAALHFDLKVKRKSLYHWRSCAARLETKKKSQGCFKELSLLHYYINQIPIHAFEYISLTDFFFFLARCYFFAFLPAVAQCFLHLRLLRMFWGKWTAALHLRQRDESSPGCLAVQHRALEASQSRILIITQTLFSSQWQHLKLVCERFSGSTQLLGS